VLGQNDDADLRKALRESESDLLLSQAIDEAISRKPKGLDSSSTVIIIAQRLRAT
jgi:cyclic pyranopterin phosphate synthase